MGLIGRTPISNEDLESDKIWTKGVIFNSEITSPSNYRALHTLDEWLKRNQIVGLTGLDTRSLTNFIRDKGAPKGTITNNKKGKFNIKKLTNMSVKWPGLNGLDLAKEVRLFMQVTKSLKHIIISKLLSKTFPRTKISRHSFSFRMTYK